MSKWCVFSDVPSTSGVKAVFNFLPWYQFVLVVSVNYTPLWLWYMRTCPKRNIMVIKMGQERKLYEGKETEQMQISAHNSSLRTDRLRVNSSGLTT